MQGLEAFAHSSGNFYTVFPVLVDQFAAIPEQKSPDNTGALNDALAQWIVHSIPDRLVFPLNFTHAY